MTDNNSKTAANDKQHSQKTQNLPEQTNNAKKTAVEAAATKDATAKTSAPEPQMKKVDIVIAGITYQIYCPVHEEAELRSAVYYINNFLLDIKKGAPSLSQENLLVLCCLNLYEKIHTQTKASDDAAQASKQAEMLLSKIMKDAQSVL